MTAYIIFADIAILGGILSRLVCLLGINLLILTLYGNNTVIFINVVFP